MRRKTAEDAKNAEREEATLSFLCVLRVLCGYQIFIFVYMNITDLKQRLKDRR
jgi:hypothetical protein